MKVLYSHRTRSADGQYVHIRAMTDALRALGHELTLCGPEGISGNGKQPRQLDAGAGETGGLVSRLPKPAYELAELAYSVPAFRRLKKAAIQHRPEIIYERYNLFFLAGTWLKQQMGLPLLLEVNAPLKQERETHGGLALGALASWSERKVWHAADALLPVTQVLAEHLVEAGADPAKIHVIPNGIDAPLLEEADPSGPREKYHLQDKTVLGFTGFVRDWHGVDHILEYMAARRDTPLHLLLVGDGPHVPALKALAERLGLQDSFTVTGVVQPEALPAYVAAFDIALQPRATSYASPLKLFEYMALGKAILAPDQPNIRETLRNRHDAALFNADNPAELYDMLDHLCGDKELRQRLGAAARQTLIDRDMTWAGNARKITRIAESLSGVPASPA